jgi:hypothetical protein
MPTVSSSIPDLLSKTVAKFSGKPVHHNFGHTLSQAALDQLARFRRVSAGAACDGKGRARRRHVTAARGEIGRKRRRLSMPFEEKRVLLRASNSIRVGRKSLPPIRRCFFLSTI